MRLWLLAAILLIGVAQTAQDSVLDRLSQVERFAFGGTGIAGGISPGERDYKTVLARSTALADFEKLFAEGNRQAKCYALVGIRKLNPTRFKELAGPLRDSKERVTTMKGCIILNEPFASILKKIESDKYR